MKHNFSNKKRIDGIITIDGQEIPMSSDVSNLSPSYGILMKI